MLKKLLYSAFLIFICTNQAIVAAETAIEIKEPWIRSAPPNVSVMAGYLQLSNHSHETVTLKSVSSKQFHSVEIHQTVHHNGMAHMKKVEPLILEGHQELKFEPGGYHLMLMDPHAPLKKGDSAHIKLIFSNGEELMVEAKVQDDSPDGTKMDHDDHHQHH